MNVAETVLSACYTATLGRGDQPQAARLEVAQNAMGQTPRPVVGLHAVATWYANRGIRVFPLTYGTKKPIKDSQGVKDATASLTAIAAWFGGDIDRFNLGIACGQPYDVLDIDNHDGAAAFGAVLGDGAWLDIQAVSETPNGIHLWVPAAPGSANQAGEGFDYRGNGGYVVAPPSHVDGTLYRWLLPPTGGTP